ncbi:bifunctional 3-deoxy-7-phosphoheptulonate synthase/chorismate mutase [Tissierella praeacuta]|uniref:bifunctional 3-deoxy-7-phosphoheptulonate synthase/chorismate mutase n=1 Tax=Tissierella praeacuta TaxID=43131 RepID=UPI0033428FED
MTRSINIDNEILIGDGSFTIIAGPCAIENYEQMDDIGKFLSSLGVRILRGGVFKPRTSPKSFQGLGLEGLEILNEIKLKYNLKVISEIMDPRDIEKTQDSIDIIQIGSRNMQNFSLLREVGKTHKPVMLKRGMSATIEEWIMAAEYIRMEGNEEIILCERGIRTFEDYTRNTLDLMSVPILKKRTDYPIFVDPSHGTGRRELVHPASKAAKALEADGVIVEIHPNPDKALSDGFQSLDFEGFENLYRDFK